MPTLESPRLVLRAHAVADFAACAAMWGDAVVVRHIGGRPSTPEETWGRMLRYVGHWQWMGYGYWAVVEKATGAFVGELGFADFRRDLEPALGAPEIGFAFAAHVHGRGYATEAARAALTWADARAPVDARFARTACVIDEGHAASLRVVEKLGYREARRARYHESAIVVLERARA